MTGQPTDFADEEVVSTYGYVSGYRGPIGLSEQESRLRLVFGGLGFVNLDYRAKIEKGEVLLPEGAEGWFCVPNWSKHPYIFGQDYSSAVRNVLGALKKVRGGRFSNYHEGEIDEKHLRQRDRTKACVQMLSDAQENPDILIVPAQFGIRHRDKSCQRVRFICRGTEWALDSFSIGCMILTHPNRLMYFQDLWIHCAGDDFLCDYEDKLERSPFFFFIDQMLKFAASRLNDTYPNDGSASAFLPE